jgi:hypothetical protein
MKFKVCLIALGLVLTFGLSAAESPNPFPEPVENLSLESLVPEATLSLATLFSCDVYCFDGTTASLTAASEVQCRSRARVACGSGNCQYWFNVNSTGLCYGGL